MEPADPVAELRSAARELRASLRGLRKDVARMPSTKTFVAIWAASVIVGMAILVAGIHWLS
jgi:hypothetical protein